MDISENLRYIPKVDLIGIVEIFLMTMAIYFIAKTVKGTRAWVLLKGIMMLMSVYIVAYLLNFTAIVLMFNKLILLLGILVILMLQPDLKRFIERLGTRGLDLKSIIKAISKKDNGNTSEENLRILSAKTIQEIVKGCSAMSKDRTGALIVIENEIPLDEYINTGIGLNADITSQLLLNIFECNTPLHDGAIIIRDNKIISATCYLPLTDNDKIDKNLGTRHRAGIGVTENSDCVVVVVSEETGKMSVVKDGKIKYNVDREKLAEELKGIKKRTVRLSKNTSVGRLTKNLGLKVICLISTIILWMMIMTAANPVVSTTVRGVHIDVINEDVLNNLGKTYEIIGKETVNVKITGRKNQIDKIKRENISVYADLSRLSLTGTAELKAELSNSSLEVELSDKMVNIEIDDITDIEYDIEVVRKKEPSNKFYISSIELDNESIVISGPKETVNKIGNVVIEIDASEITEDTELSLKPIVYDKNGDVMSKDKLSLSVNNIMAKVNLYNTKLVQLNIFTNIKSDILNHILKDVRYENKYIYIAGSDEILREYDYINIDLDIESIDLKEVSKNSYIKTIELDDYLPEGIYVGSEYAKEKITLNFKEFYYKELEFESKDINIVGGNLSNTIMGDKKFSLKVVSFNELDKDDLRPYIDIQNINKPWAGVTKIQFKGFNKGMQVFGDTSINISTW